MIKPINRNKIRLRKHVRVRKKISGTSNKPRLSVFRSARHIYAQLVDDVAGITLVHASTLESAMKDTDGYTGNKDAAKAVGKLVGEKALARGITQVVFDRGGYLYHGRVKELATGAREAGLEF